MSMSAPPIDETPPGGTLLVGVLPAGVRLAVGRFDAYASGAPPPPLPASTALKMRRLPPARSTFYGTAAQQAAHAAAAESVRSWELAPAAASAARSGAAAAAAAAAGGSGASAGTHIGTRETMAGNYRACGARHARACARASP